MRNLIHTFSTLVLAGCLLSVYAFDIPAVHATTSSLEGVWEGSYKCGQGPTGATLTIAQWDEEKGQGTFKFYNLSGRNNSGSGSYEVHLSRTDPSAPISVRPHRWIKQPGGYTMVGFSLQQQQQFLNGKVDFGGCSTISLERLQVSSSDMTALNEQTPAESPSSLTPNGVIVHDISEHQGFWVGNVETQNAPFMANRPVELTLTSQGGLLTYTKNNQKCKWFISAEFDDKHQFLAQAIKGTSPLCNKGFVSLSRDAEKLRLSSATLFEAPFVLERQIGPQVTTAPPKELPLTLLKVKLGDNIEHLQTLAAAPVSYQSGRHGQPQGQLSQYHQNMPLDSVFTTVIWPFEDTPDAHEDVLTAFSSAPTKNDIVALQRIFRPRPDRAPSHSSYLSALQQQFGPPSIRQADRRTTILTWHYSKEGALLSDNDITRCEVKANASSTAFGSTLTSSYQWFKLYQGRVQTSEQQTRHTIIPVPECGYTLTYRLTVKDGDALRELNAVAYDHNALSNAIWQAKLMFARAELRQVKKRLSAREQTAPRL